MIHFKQNNQNIALNIHKNPTSDRNTLIYKALYQLNDIILGLICLYGSFIFFNSATVTTGTVLLVIGSIQMTIRPLIAFTHD